MTDTLGQRDASDCNLCATRTSCVASHVPAAELSKLQPLIRKQRVRRGEPLAEEGEMPRVVRVLKVGNAFGYRRGLDGRLRPVGMAGRGATFGLFGVFGQKTQVSVAAACPGRVCEIPADALRELTARDRRLADDLLNAATESCGRIAAWSEAMRVRGVANQLAYSLLLLAEAQRSTVVELPSHIALAELLGTTRETIARCLGVLEDEGRIQRGARKQCEVHRGPLLARLEGLAPA